MGEELRAIARAVRRPMRRWWLRHGAWWIGAIVVLYAAAFLLIRVVTLTWTAGGVLNQPLGVLASICAALAVLMATVCWILAALRCSALISDALAGFAHPREHAVRRARLALCFWQGIALFVVVAALHGLLRLQQVQLQDLLDAASPQGLLPVDGFWYLAKVTREALSTLWPIPFCMLWFCGLLAAWPERPLSALPWTLPALVPLALELVSFVDFQRAVVRGVPGLINNMGRLPYIHLPALWPLGYLLLLLLLWSTIARRWQLQRALYVLLLASVIAYIPNWHSVAVNANPAPEHPVVQAANALGALSAMALTFPFEFATRDRRAWTDAAGNPLDRPSPAAGTLRIRSAYAGVLKDRPNCWAGLALLGNLAWLTAQYFILAAVLGWRGRRANAAAAMRG